MKYTLTLAAVAGLVMAQDFSGQPDCAIPCLESSIPEVGCEIEDTACQCAPEVQSALQPLVAPCILDNCNGTELAQALSAGEAACSSFLATASDTGSVTLSVTQSGVETDLSDIISSPSGNATQPGTSSVPASETVTETSSVPETTITTTTSGPAATETDQAEETTTTDDNAAPAATPLFAGAAIAAILGVAAAL